MACRNIDSVVLRNKNLRFQGWIEDTEQAVDESYHMGISFYMTNIRTINQPAITWGYLVTYWGDPKDAIQLFYYPGMDGATIFYTRARSNGTFGTWKKVEF